MNNKLFQVVDNVHGTIYYSEIEKDIMGTPYFNRLHDVNQSSTVYFTFPPNRTKRYEHSLGTMQITSDIFFNAFTNATGSDACNILLENAERYFDDIYNFFSSNSDYPFNFGQEIINEFDFFRHTNIDKIKEDIQTNFLECFSDNYLIQYIPRYLEDGFKSFLFLLLMQSLRIVGLLHDCGHPPQSHIIESILNEIYDETKTDTLREQKYIKILDTFKKDKNEQLEKIDKKMALKTENGIRDALHEMVALQVIFNIFNSIFPNFFLEDIKSDYKNIKILYHLCLIEFSFAIVRNKTNYWRGLHDIIDGVIDSDRLDFVSRDSTNSGMKWGTTLYKRLINSSKFQVIDYKTKDVRVSFSDKSLDSMDELIRNRYKIFSLINYHHRSTRTAILYQLAVKIIALDYLNKKEKESELLIYDDISGLWRAIEQVYSPRLTMLNFIQWNDSWLNGLLSKKLIELSSKNSLQPLEMQCKEILEEIFLSKKNYLSLIKRNTEQREINGIIIKHAESLLKALIAEKKIALCEIANSENSLKKVTTKPYIKKHQLNLRKSQLLFEQLDLAYEAIIECRWNELESTLGLIYEPSIIKVLNNYFNKDEYIVNKIKFSLGLSGKAYVFDYDDKTTDYLKCSTIKSELECMHKDFPYYYVYVNANKCNSLSLKFKDIRHEIGVEIANTITNKCKMRFDIKLQQEEYV